MRLLSSKKTEKQNYPIIWNLINNFICINTTFFFFIINKTVLTLDKNSIQYDKPLMAKNLEKQWIYLNPWILSKTCQISPRTYIIRAKVVYRCSKDKKLKTTSYEVPGFRLAREQLVTGIKVFVTDPTTIFDRD